MTSAGLHALFIVGLLAPSTVAAAQSLAEGSMGGPTLAACLTEQPAGPGVLWGTIRDQRGRPLQSVTVTTRGDSTTTCRTLTGTLGRYEIRGLLPGAYVVSVDLILFAPISLSVTVGPEPLRRDVTMARSDNSLDLPQIGSASYRISLPRDAQFLGCFAIRTASGYAAAPPFELPKRIEIRADTLGDGTVRIIGLGPNGQRGWALGAQGDSIWAQFGEMSTGLRYHLARDEEGLRGVSQYFSDVIAARPIVRTQWYKFTCQ